MTPETSRLFSPLRPTAPLLPGASGPSCQGSHKLAYTFKARKGHQLDYGSLAPLSSRQTLLNRQIMPFDCKNATADAISKEARRLIDMIRSCAPRENSTGVLGVVDIYENILNDLRKRNHCPTRIESRDTRIPGSGLEARVQTNCYTQEKAQAAVARREAANSAQILREWQNWKKS